MAADAMGILPFSYAEKSGAQSHEMRAVIRAAEMRSMLDSARRTKYVQQEAEFPQIKRCSG